MVALSPPGSFDYRCDAVMVLLSLLRSKFQMQNKLFVRNLSFNTEDADLSTLFGSYGQVVSARVATDRDTGRGRGFGFVEMSTQQSAEKAIDALDSTEFGGRTIHVAISQPRERGPHTRSW